MSLSISHAACEQIAESHSFVFHYPQVPRQNDSQASTRESNDLKSRAKTRKAWQHNV